MERPAVYAADRSASLFVGYSFRVSCGNACSVPFAIADKVYSPTDYLVPALNGLPAVMLLFVATLLVKLIKRRNLDKHGSHLMKSKAQGQ